MITGQIPLPGNPLDSFGKSFNGMDQFFQQLKAHQLAKQQFSEQLRQHQVAEQMAKASAGRAAALAPLQKMLLQAKISHQANLDNPAFKAQQFAALMQKMKEMKGGQQGQQELGAENNMAMPEQEQAYGLGQGMMMPEQMQEAAQQMPQESSQQGSAMDYNDPDARMAYQSVFGKEMPKPYESPAQKQQREIQTSTSKEQNKIDLKRAQELRETAKDLVLAGMDVNGIHDLLTGPDSLSTGITKTLIGKAGFGSYKLGVLNERALRLQAQMARALSSRGGEGAAKIVASGKPSSWKGTSENLGITDAYAERIKNEFDLINQEYKKIAGEDLPYTLSEYVHNAGRKIDSNIFKPKTFFATKKDYHDYMGSLTPEQRKIALKKIRGDLK